MIPIIQCAASKRPEAGHLQGSDGHRVLFVANPGQAPVGQPYRYARPDDRADTGNSWRDELLEYNRHYKETGSNPLGLLPARRLYRNDTYPLLAQRYGPGNFYILSAGWGLIAADFLTPKYDITFSNQAEGYKQRRKNDHYDDLHMLPAGAHEPVVFFVSKAYVPLACALTRAVKGPKHLFYNTATPPEAPGFQLHKYETRTRTNWHYECARAFMDGRVGV